MFQVLMQHVVKARFLQMERRKGVFHVSMRQLRAATCVRVAAAAAVAATAAGDSPPARRMGLRLRSPVRPELTFSTYFEHMPIEQEAAKRRKRQHYQ